MKAIETSLVGDPIVVPHETTLELYRKMLTVFFVEERMKVFAKQGKCSFNASTRGHEKVQIGMTMLLRPGFDWFFPTTGRKRWPLVSVCLLRTSFWDAQP